MAVISKTNVHLRRALRRAFLFLTIAASCALPFTALRGAEPPAPAKAAGTVPVEPPVPLIKISREHLAEIFSPYRTEHTALSPDGRYVAYSIREGEELSVVVVEIDHPETAKTRVQVATDKTSTPALLSDSAEKTPAEIRWMQWATPNRLVVETNRSFPVSATDTWSNVTGAIMAFDADGGNATTLVTPREVAFRSLDFQAFSKPDPTIFTHATTRPDEPTTSPATSSSSTDSSTIDTTDLGDPPPSTVSVPDTVHELRSPHVHDFMAGEPGCLLVRAEGSSHLGRYKLNAVTGKLSALSEEVLDAGAVLLLDRKAYPRGSAPSNLRIAFPHNFSYDAGGLMRWKKLDSLPGGTAGALGFHVSPANFFGERSVPIGFDENPEVLYYASNIGRDTYGLYSLSLKTGQRKGFSFENPHVDLLEPEPGGFARANPLVFDRYHRELIGVRFEETWRTTRWLRPELQTVQATLEKTLPARSVDLLEWNETEKRFLVLARGPADPGTYFIFDADKPRLAEFVHVAPPAADKMSGETAVLSFNDSAGRQIGALLTLPNRARPKPVALAVLCPPDPWSRVHTDYSRDVEALAEMGLAVLQVNGRGAFGFGLKQREELKPGFEESQVEDILSTLDYLQKYLPLNFKRVILTGSGWGGFVALRGVQLYPDRFRAAVTLNPTVDPGDWLSQAAWTEGDPGVALTRSYYGDAARLKAAPLVHGPGKMAKPVLILSYRGKSDGPPTAKFLVAERFAAAVRSAGGWAEFGELSEDYMRGLPVARAEAYEKIQEFLNDALFKFEVKVGETKEVKP